MTVTNSTFSGNVSNGSGAIFASGNPLLLRNTIIANSTGGNCSAGLIDGGGNLSDDASCGFTAASSLNSTAAQLGVLANNGGPTMTIAPLTGSPAIDQGVNTLATDAGSQPLATDQRGTGFPRISPSGGTVDRGAFEVQVVVPPLVLTTCPASTAQVGVAYGSALVATGGVPPNTFSLISGSLPGGLTLNPGSGAITGTPGTAGPFPFTAQVVDSANPIHTISLPCSIAVSPAAGAQLSVTPSNVSFGTVPRFSLRIKTVTLKNNGPGSVTLGRVSVTPNPGASPGHAGALTIPVAVFDRAHVAGAPQVHHATLATF